MSGILAASGDGNVVFTAMYHPRKFRVWRYYNPSIEPRRGDTFVLFDNDGERASGGFFLTSRLTVWLSFAAVKSLTLGSF